MTVTNQFNFEPYSSELILSFFYHKEDFTRKSPSNAMKERFIFTRKFFFKLCNQQKNSFIVLLEDIKKLNENTFLTD